MVNRNLHRHIQPLFNTEAAPKIKLYLFHRLQLTSEGHHGGFRNRPMKIPHNARPGLRTVWTPCPTGQIVTGTSSLILRAYPTYVLYDTLRVPGLPRLSYVP